MERRSCCTETEGIYCELYTKAVEYYAMIGSFTFTEKAAKSLQERIEFALGN